MKSEIDSLKEHLSLCSSLFEATLEAAGIDRDETKMKIVIKGEDVADIAIGAMLDRWKEMSK